MILWTLWTLWTLTGLLYIGAWGGHLWKSVLSRDPNGKERPTMQRPELALPRQGRELLQGSRAGKRHLQGERSLSQHRGIPWGKLSPPWLKWGFWSAELLCSSPALTSDKPESLAGECRVTGAVEGHFIDHQNSGTGVPAGRGMTLSRWLPERAQWRWRWFLRQLVFLIWHNDSVMKYVINLIGEDGSPLGPARAQILHPFSA